MLSAPRLVRLNEYSGSISRDDLPDPADNSRTLKQILATIQKVLGKAAGSSPSGQATILKMRAKDKSATFAGQPKRTPLQRKDTEPGSNDY